MYKLMLETAEKGKKIRFEATEDTSYINIMNMSRKGLVEIEEDEQRAWNEANYNEENITNTEEETKQDVEDITMHNMVVNVNEEKLAEEIARIQNLLDRVKEKRMFANAISEI